ncbi:MAG: hypothetical protein KTR31_38405 [Myxococcales bacterium]|nr:hypothetical protein [Myxococcales bacterium]
MSPRDAQGRALATRIRTFVDGSLAGRPSERFEELALAVHAYQVPRDPVVASLLEGPVRTWTDVPAVPVDLFKELPVGTLQQEEPAVVFLTSGTTRTGRGAHRLRSTDLYDPSSLAWARRCVPGMPPRVVALLDDPARAPESSLSHMVALFGPATWHTSDGTLHAADASAAVREGSGPVFLASTAFALAEWLDHAPPALPPGSVVMVTGGFKGRVHRLEGEALMAAARATLRPARLVTEYGMTELCSQLWGTPGSSYLPPPWLRAVAVDPSGAPVPAGTPGQLRFYDLANLDSTLGIETMDEGVVRSDGSVWLLGRLQGAPARGCSLTVEEAWGRRSEG